MEDGEQVYSDWDHCSRKLWDSRDLAWQLEYAPVFLTPCEAPAEAICWGEAAVPDCMTLLQPDIATYNKKNIQVIVIYYVLAKSADSYALFQLYSHLKK